MTKTVAELKVGEIFELSGGRRFKFVGPSTQEAALKIVRDLDEKSGMCGLFEAQLRTEGYFDGGVELYNGTWLDNGVMATFMGDMTVEVQDEKVC